MKLIKTPIKDSLARVKAKLLPAESVLIIPHNFPDPDSIGASLGIQHLLYSEGVKSCTIAFSGFVGRAENRAMVDLLDIEYKSLLDDDIAKFDKVVVVDTSPTNGNVSIKNPDLVDVVIDHHSTSDIVENGYTLFEVNPNVGASSTLVTLFLLANGTPIPPRVATALFYGIKTDTSDMGRNTHDIDISCYKVLFDLINHKILSHIENPQRDAEYLKMLNMASEKMEVYGDFGFTFLGETNTPDYVPEMADICHSFVALEWMVCCAVFEDNMIFSIRSKSNPMAGVFTRKLALSMNGSGGGHSTMAAGRIPVNGKSTVVLLKDFRETLFSIFSVDKNSCVSILDM